MNDRGMELLKAYLDKDGNERLRKYLNAKTLAKLDVLPDLVIPTRFPGGEVMEKIHWSWFLPVIQDCSEDVKRLYIGALPEQTAHSLSEALHLKGEHLTEPAKNHFSHELYQVLLSSRTPPLPPECLPHTSLNPLLGYSKKDLLRLIDYLALFDLAVEVRQIVETKILKKLYSFLSEGERNALKNISVTKEGGPLPKMGLDRWDGTEESLKHLLHRRGLQRLAIALSGAHPDLIWHIAHQLDSGRGGTLLKIAGNEVVPHWTELAIRHIEDWIKAI